MNATRSVAVVLAAALVGLFGCAAPTDDTTSSPGAASPIPHPNGADERVVQIASGGGLIPMQVAVAEIPEWTLYGDGTIVFLAPATDAAAPPPAVPDLRQQQVPPEAIDTLLAAAAEEDMLSDRHLTASEATDLWTTSVSIAAASDLFQNSVYALGFDPDEGAPPPPADQTEAIAQVQSFIELAEDPERWSSSVTPAVPYTGEAWKVWAFPAQAPAEPDETTATWPLRAAFLEDLPDEGACTVVTGDDLAKLRTTAAQTDASMPWRSRATGKERFTLVFVPVLPGEEPTCSAI